MRSIKEMDKRLDEREQEIERLNNIIKEVREYIEENMSYNTGVEIQYIPSGEDLLEILNKGGNK